MYWRIRRKGYDSLKGAETKRKMNNLIENGTIPGILTYQYDKLVGWCSMARRDDFPALKNSRILRKIDDKPIWSVVCFYINKNYRRKGLTVELLKAAKKYVKIKKGKIIEGYPVEPKSGKTADAFVWTDLASAFLKAGFKGVERRSETRPIMRFFIK
jgi:GNAT superfamily N-acetyltransferase